MRHQIFIAPLLAALLWGPVPVTAQVLLNFPRMETYFSDFDNGIHQDWCVADSEFAIPSDAELLFTPSGSADHGLRIGADFDLPPKVPTGQYPVLVIDADVRFITLTVSPTPGENCYDVANDALDRVLKRLGGDSAGAEDHLNDRRTGLIEARDLLTPGTSGWLAMQAMVEAIDNQLALLSGAARPEAAKPTQPQPTAPSTGSAAVAPAVPKQSDE